VTSSSGEVPTGVVSLSGSDGFGQDDHANSVRNHHFAHYSASSHVRIVLLLKSLFPCLVSNHNFPGLK
jgi:hypothetical protein